MAEYGYGLCQYPYCFTATSLASSSCGESYVWPQLPHHSNSYLLWRISICLRKLMAILQTLMDRNTEGALSPAEREELEALVELAKPSRCYAYRRCACSDGLCMSLSRAEIKHSSNLVPGNVVNTVACISHCKVPPSMSNILCRSLWGGRTIWITWPGLALAVISQSRIVSLLSIPRRVGKCACCIHALTAGKNIWRGRATCWWC